MDPNNNTNLFLKLIEDYDPIFLVCFFSFLFSTHNNLLQLICFFVSIDTKYRMILQPYCGENNFHTVNLFKLLMMTYSWVVRLKRNVSGPVFGDGFTKVVRDSSLLADKFWRDSYDKNFKGGEATLYVGDRYWNVKMEGWSDRSAFTDGLSKLIEDLALDSLLCCLQVGYKTFEVFVFNHETGTEVVVLDDSIYGDEGFDLLIVSEHKKQKTNESHVDEGLKVLLGIGLDTDDSKFDLHIAALLEM
ncbi:putative transcription factor B3-Domain family [Helianthus debilis subsp. tardiflorus]